MSDLSSKRPSAFLPAAGWIPWPGRSQIRLTGADRAKFLHNFCTNDIKKLQPGQGCEAFLTTIKGRILGHIFVFAGENDLMIDTVPGEDIKIRDHLDRYLITEDAQIEVVTDQYRCGYLFGSDWPSLLKHGIGVEVSGLAPYQQIRNEQFGVLIRRMDQTATAGFEILVPPAAVEALTSSFWVRDDQPPLRVSEQAFEAYRIDAGFPTYGIDLTDDHLAQEAARTEQAISFTKGCYLGQEPIARIDALGHVNRELRVVAFESGDSLAAPAKVLDASTKAELGNLTSLGRTPGSVTIGLGMLRTSARPGIPVVTTTEQGEFTGTVVDSAARPGT
jgi:folate-binding protein YgfZ